MKKKGKLWLLIMFVILLSAGFMTTVKNDDVKAGEGSKSITPIQLPNSFLTDVKIYKAVSPNYIKFEDDKTEVKRNSAFSAEFKYRIPAASELSGGQPMVSGQPYTFWIQGNFLKENINFNIRSESSNHIVANGSIGGGEKVVLTFTSAADAENLLAEGTEGTFWFKGYFDESKIENIGEQDFTLNAANLQASARINFACDQIEGSAALTKTGTADLDSHTITWKIKAVPEIKNANTGDKKFVKWSIQDKIPDKLSYVKKNGDMGCYVKVTTVSGSAVIGTENLTGGQGTYDDAAKIFTFQFPENMDIENKTFELTITTSFNPTESGFLNASGKVIFKNKATSQFEYPQYKKDNTVGSPTQNQVVVSDSTRSGNVTSNESVIEIVGSALTKSGALQNGSEITWTIKVKNSFKLENPKLVDTLPAYTTLVSGSVTLDGNPLTTTNNGSDPYYEENSGTMTVYLNKDNSSEQALTYKTKFNPEWKDHNTNGIVQNKIEFYGGPGNGLIVGPKTAAVNLNSQIMTKSGEYDRSNHTITWKINVRNTGTGLTNIKFTDVIPANQEYVTGSMAATGAAIMVKESENKIILEYPDHYNSWDSHNPTIAYKTKLTDAQKDWWGNNLPSPGRKATNKITLTADGLPAKELSVNGEAAVTSKVLEKQYVSYDYTTKKVKWRLLVNDNQMTITDPKIEDVIPEGWKFVPNSIIVQQNGVEVTPAALVFTNADKKIEIALPSMTAGMNAQPYKIEYETRLVDDSILTTTNTIKAKNTAVLTGNEIAAGVKVESAHSIAKPVLEKSGDNSTLNQGYLTWNIVVNRTMSEISAFGVSTTVAIEDDIQKNLAPIMESIEVYELSIAADGRETKAKKLTFGSEYTTSYDITTRKLIIDFGMAKITKAYLITFHTDVAVEGSYTNSVQFLGSSEADKKKTSEAVMAVFSGGTTRPVYGSIKIIKENEENAVLAGAEFAITSKLTGKLIGKGITDNNGILEFSPLKAGEYVITETKAPNGYELPDSVSQDIIISKTNKDVEVTIRNKKKTVSTPTPTQTPAPSPTPTSAPPVVVPTPPVIQPTPSAVPSVPPASSAPETEIPAATITPSPSNTPTPTAMPRPGKKPEKTAAPTKIPDKHTEWQEVIINNKEREKRENTNKKVKKEDEKTRTENANINKRPPNENDRKQKSENQDVPRTGDNTHFKTYCIIFVFSFIILLYCIRMHWEKIKAAKKNKRNK